MDSKEGTNQMAAAGNWYVPSSETGMKVVNIKQLNEQFASQYMTAVEESSSSPDQEEQFQFFLLQAIPLIERFDILFQSTQKITFFTPRPPSSSSTDTEQKDSSSELNAVVQQYLLLLASYFPSQYESMGLSSLAHYKINPSTESYSPYPCAASSTMTLETADTTYHHEAFSSVAPSSDPSLAGISDRTTNNTLSSKDRNNTTETEEKGSEDPRALVLHAPLPVAHPRSSCNRSKLSTDRCAECGSKASFFHDGHWVCEDCGFILLPSMVPLSYKDIDRINMSKKFQYDRITHFKECINQFQGKQKSTIPANVYETILSELIQHGLIPPNWEELPREETFRNVTKQHILLFLKGHQFTKCYEDVVYIHSKLTGTSPPDISHLENVLLRDFTNLSNLYDKMYRSINRKNFMNSHYVLYQLLRHHKFPCQKEDFNILKTTDRKYYHDIITMKLFSILELQFSPTF